MVEISPTNKSSTPSVPNPDPATASTTALLHGKPNNYGSMRSSDESAAVKPAEQHRTRLGQILSKRRRKLEAWAKKTYVDGEAPPTPGGAGRQMIDDEDPKNITWKYRVRHFTFTWFTLTMSTAGIAHVLKQVPLRFDGLYAIGCMFMILNFLFFISNCTMMGLRFYWFPHTFKAAFIHPTESLFIPAFVLSVAQILINITEYGLSPGRTGQWLLTTMTVCYWLYMAVAVAFSVGIYLIMWSTQTFTLSAMTPVWIFPAYPLLLVGPFAGVLSQALLTEESGPSHTRLHIIVGGVICQGLGFLLSCMIYAAFLYRLMTHKLPAESTRPGMFVSVGPSGFTVSALISMGAHFPTVVPEQFMGNGALAGQVTQIIAYWAGLWLYGLAVWFFLVSTFAHWSCVGGNRLTFAMTWYAFVFPNTSLITSTFNVARALGDNKPLQIIGCVGTVLLICVWSFIIGMNLRAIVLKQVLWPQNGEDSKFHIFKDNGERRRTQDDGVAGGQTQEWATATQAVGEQEGKGGQVRKREGKGSRKEQSRESRESRASGIQEGDMAGIGPDGAASVHGRSTRESSENRKSAGSTTLASESPKGHQYDERGDATPTQHTQRRPEGGDLPLREAPRRTDEEQGLSPS